jgi:hypothetical protein
MSLFFAIPVVIVASYYFFGWAIAVSLLPVLAIVAWLSQRFKQKSVTRSSRTRSGKVLFWLTICGIPLTAILTSEPEVMRTWAIAAGTLLSGMGLGDERAKRSEAASISDANRGDNVFSIVRQAAPGALFVLGSELIWHLAGFGPWIWYHAFFLQIFAVLLFMVQELTRTFQGQDPEGGVIEAKPPKARSQSKGERHTVLIKHTDGRWLRYDEITLGQALALFRDRHSGEGSKLSGIEQSELRRAFNIDFGGWTKLNIFSEDGTSMLVEWTYVRPATHFFGMPFDTTAAQGVPIALGRELLELGWREDWDSITARLEPFVGLKQPRSL